MHTTISVRHTEITADLRSRTDGVMARIGQLSPHALESTVVFDQSPTAHLVEIRLHMRGGLIVVGHGEGPDHRTALDRADEKVRRQLERNGSDARRSRGPTPRRP
jgi:ribosomal subunit interface protein